jgi:glycosyltransferase involved in cell wall biosynthesis
MQNAYSVKVSIIITCYNLENYIATAVHSLLNQQCNFEFEIILIDDASSDGSKQVIQNIKDERVHFISLDKNVGAPRAINICYSKVKGEYVCRFDGDDRWHPDYLKKAVTILEQYPEVELVYTDVAFINEHDVVTSKCNNISRPPHLKMIDNEFEAILEHYYINAPTIMARKKTWDKAMPWLEQFRKGLGDWYCSLLMLEKGLSCFINEPLAYYRIHSSNMHRAMVKDGSGEINTLWILDFFKKRTSHIKSPSWDRIYFEQNKHLGFSYFFHEMDKDARRCLARAINYQPVTVFNMSFLRIFVASVIGQKWYNRIKKVLGKTSR